MLKDNNVKLTWSDGLCEYQMEYQPHIDPYVEHIQFHHDLDRGKDAYYHIGYKFHCVLKWDGNNFFRGDQFDSLREIFNTYSGLCIYPAPDTHPNCHYAVMWVNDFDFHLKEGAVEMGYNGSIVLRGSDVLSEIDQYLAMANTF